MWSDEVRRAASGPVLMLVFLAACGEADRAGGSKGVSVRAGPGADTIVVHPEAFAAAPVIDLHVRRYVEYPVAGRTDDDVSLFRVAGAILSPTGELVVANGVPGGLTWVDSAGARKRSLSGEGEGPGEFRWLEWLAVCGDSAFTAYDAGLRRVTRLTWDGEVELILNAAPLDGTARFRDCLEDGSFTATVGRPWPAEAGVGRAELTLLIVDEAGVVTDTVGVYPWTEMFVDIADRIVAPTPLGRRTVLGTTDSHLVVGTGDGFELELVPLRDSFDGASSGAGRAGVVRLEREPLRLSQTEAHDLATWWLSRFSRLPDELVKRVVSAGLPDAPPPFDGLLVDADERLWLHLFPSPEDGGHVWLGVGLDGEFLCKLTVPYELSVSFIDSGAVVGIWRDAVDVETVRRYAVPGIGDCRMPRRG
jgi:hypothetical protein